MSKETEHTLHESPIVAIGAVASISKVAPYAERHFIGVRYYADALGAGLAVPTAGTVLIEALDETTNQWTPTAAVLDATDLTDKESIAGNIKQVRATPTALNVATHYQLFCSSNL